MGLVYLAKAGNDSFLERWIDAFIRENPRLFGRRGVETRSDGDSAG